MNGRLLNYEAHTIYTLEENAKKFPDKIEFIINMFKDNISIQQIARIVDLPEEQVEAICKRANLL